MPRIAQVSRETLKRIAERRQEQTDAVTLTPTQRAEALERVRAAAWKMTPEGWGKLPAEEQRRMLRIIELINLGAERGGRARLSFGPLLDALAAVQHGGGDVRS